MMTYGEAMSNAERMIEVANHSHTSDMIRADLETARTYIMLASELRALGSMGLSDAEVDRLINGRM